MLFRLGLLLINVGFFFSRFALSLGMIVLIVNFVFSKKLPARIKKYCCTNLLIFECIFLVYFLNGVHSQNMDYFLERIQIILPFLVLPLSFSSVKISKQEFHFWLFFFVVLAFGTSGLSFIKYMATDNLGFEQTTGPIMSTGINHVHFSLIVSISLLASIYLLLQDLGNRARKKVVLLFIAPFLLFYLHYNGVRGGIAGFYISLVTLIFFYKKQLDFKRVMIPIVLLPVFLIVMFHSAPHFKNKMVNTAISLSEFCANNKISNLSDFGRFESIKTGVEVGRTNPLFGVGLGDLKDNMYKRSDLPLLPHNQFVFIFAFSGLLGLFVVIFNLARLLLVKTKTPVFFLAFNSIFYFSFIIEHPFERQLGVGLFLYFNLLILSISNNHNELHTSA